MVKRKEFILGAVVGLTLAAAATAGGVIDWPSANAGPVAGASGRLTPNGGRPGLAFAPPQGAPLSFADIFQQVAPAVVQIDVEARVPRRRSIQIPGMPEGFGIPLPEGVQPEGEGEEGADEGATALGAGSGFFISSDGYIVTNNHVIADAIEITVRLADERELTARVVGRDESTDLAVIKVEGENFPFVSFEEQAQPRVGDWVIAVGNPFGLGGSATAGIVSAQGRNQLDATTPYTDYIQIDAAINRGNSGGPTFDIYGRVIGVNSAIYSPTGGSVGIGFAIPANVAKPITDRLMRGEAIQRGYIGVEIAPLTRGSAEALGLESADGAFVNSVTADGPAALAGLQPGDIVLRLDGRGVEDSTALTRSIGQVRPGQNLKLDILRDGRARSVTIRSGVRPSETELNAGRRNLAEAAAPPEIAVTGVAVDGLTVAPLSPALREQLKIPAGVNGVVVTQPGRGGARNFEPGFVIMRAGNGPVRGVADLQRAVQAARASGRNTVFLHVWTPIQNAPFLMELRDPD